MRATPVLCVLLAAIVLAPAEAPSQAPLRGLRYFQVRMTTTFEAPKDGKEIDRLRVWHALPTPRSWASLVGGVKAEKGAPAYEGAYGLTWMPDLGRRQYLKSKDSHHVYWEIRDVLPPGKRFSFTSEFTVASKPRTFDLLEAKGGWPGRAPKGVDTPPDLAKLADAVRAREKPAEAVLAFTRWITANLRYDASVGYPHNDLRAILKEKRGHCGHYYTVMEALCKRVGLPIRRVFGLNLYAPNGKGALGKIRPDYVNVHTWAEVGVPGFGWVEVEPAQGGRAFYIPATWVQNNPWFQNYAVWAREDGREIIPPWTYRDGRYTSAYGVTNTITYKEVPAPGR